MTGVRCHAPAVGTVGGHPRHDRPKPLHALTGEGGLGDPPLPLPEGTATGQQAVAEHHAHGIEGGRVLVVVGEIVEQHVADDSRIGDEVAPRQADLQGNHASLPGPAAELPERVPGEGFEVAADRFQEEACDDAGHVGRDSVGCRDECLQAGVLSETRRRASGRTGIAYLTALHGRACRSDCRFQTDKRYSLDIPMPAFAEGVPNVRPGKVIMMDTMPPACGARRWWRCSRSMPFPLLRCCAGAAGRGPMIQGQGGPPPNSSDRPVGSKTRLIYAASGEALFRSKAFALQSTAYASTFK